MALLADQVHQRIKGMNKTLACGILLCMWNLELIAQDNKGDPVSNLLLDDSHPKKVMSIIDKFISENDVNQIIVGLHNKDYGVQAYCLDKLPALSESSQAKVLSRILLDDKLLQYGDELPSGGGKRMSLQTKLQGKIRMLSYGLLHQQPPSLMGLMPRAEAVSLASKLMAVGQR